MLAGLKLASFLEIELVVIVKRERGGKKKRERKNVVSYLNFWIVDTSVDTKYSGVRDVETFGLVHIGGMNFVAKAEGIIL